MLSNSHSIDQFIVFDPEDPLNASYCRTQKDARDAASSFENPVRVYRVTLGELARDVTDEFMTDDEAEDDRAYADRRFSDARERLERAV